MPKIYTYMMYSPGLHQLLRLEQAEVDLLKDVAQWQSFIMARLLEADLSVVGVAAHEFDTGGFTAAICLKESHLSIHTWPEFQLLTLDIYLCNYQRDNSSLVKALSQANVDYFKAQVAQLVEVYR